MPSKPTEDYEREAIIDKAMEVGIAIHKAMRLHSHPAVAIGALTWALGNIIVEATSDKADAEKRLPDIMEGLQAVIDDVWTMLNRQKTIDDLKATIGGLQ